MYQVLQAKIKAIVLTISVVSCFLFQAAAQTTLAPGDVAIIGFNSTNPDKFAVVLLRDIAANTVINFTDNGFTSPTTGVTTEGFLTYTAPAVQCAGTVLVWTNGMVIAGTGWNSNNPTNFAFNNAGEQLFAFQGPTANWATQNGITLIYGIQTIGNWLTTGTATSTTSYNPASLASTYKVEFPVNNNFALTAATLTGSPSSILSTLALLPNYTQTLHPTPVTFPTYTQFSLFSASFSYSGSPFCDSDATAQLVTFSGLSGGTYTGNNGLIINSTSGSITPSSNLAGNFTVTYTVVSSLGCIDLTATTQVDITALPSASISYTGSPFCNNASTQAVVLTGSLSGAFSSTQGLSLDANSGTLTPSTSTGGSYVVTYTIPAANGCGVVTATSNVDITTLPTATISYLGSPFCSTTASQSVTLTGTTGGSFSSTNGLTLDANTGAIDPSTSTVANYTITYTIAAANGCSAQTATANVAITAQPSASFSYTNSPFCSNASSASPSLTGTSGGTYSSTNGLSINSGTGAVLPSSSTPASYTVTYTVAANGGCSAFSTTSNVDITALPTATISYLGSPFCSTAASQSVTLTGTTGGAFSSTNGLTLDANTGAIDPSTSTAANYTITYTMAAANGCAAQTATANVAITAQPSASFSYTNSPFCSNAPSVLPTLTGTSGGTYSSTNGLSINSGSGDILPSSSTPASYTVTYTVAANGGCSAFSTTSNVDITALPTATISYLGSPFCSTAASQSVTLTGTTGGAFSSTNGLTLDANTGAIDPSTSTVANYTITYTMPAANGCAAQTATANVAITAQPSASFSYTNSPFCSNASSASPSLTGTSGGTYSSTNGISINSGTGDILPSSSTPASYTVTYTVAATGGCSAFSTTSNVDITALPTATISYLGSPFCSTAASQSVTLTGTTGGAFSSTNGLTLDANTGAIDPSTSTVANYTITYTMPAANGCAAQTATANISINAVPNASISYTSSPFCSTLGGQSVSLTGTTGGIFSTTTGLTINSTTGEITPSSSTIGDYTITYTIAASGGCLAQSNTTDVSVVASPTVSIAYAQNTSCNDDTPVQVSLTGASGGVYSTTSGLNLNAASGEFTPVGSTAGNYIITYTPPSVGGCVSQPDTETVTIFSLPIPIVTSSAPVALCFGDSVSLTSDFSTENTWSNGETTQTIWVNSADSYTVTVTDANGCSGTSTPANVTVAASVNASVSISPSNNITATNAGQNYQWIDCDNNNLPISGEVAQNYLPTQSGNYAVVVTENGCSSTSSCVQIVIVGINSNPVNQNLTVFPNPTNGLFEVSTPSLVTNLFIKVVTIDGRTILEKLDIPTNKAVFDLSTQPAGIYFIEISNGDQIERNKVIKI